MSLEELIARFLLFTVLNWKISKIVLVNLNKSKEDIFAIEKQQLRTIFSKNLLTNTKNQDVT